MVSNSPVPFPLQRFIIILTDHLAKCEAEEKDYSTPWYKWVIERLQQVFLLVSIHSLIMLIFIGMCALLPTIRTDKSFSPHAGNIELIIITQIVHFMYDLYVETLVISFVVFFLCSIVILILRTLHEMLRNIIARKLIYLQ